jgi:hypothetical protein
MSPAGCVSAAIVDGPIRARNRCKQNYSLAQLKAGIYPACAGRAPLTIVLTIVMSDRIECSRRVR